MTDRELDALVAEKVMGLATIIVSSNAGDVPAVVADDSPIGFRMTPRYSTDIAAAWLVVEKMRQKGYSVRIDCQWGKISGEPWDVWFRGGRSYTQRLSLSLPHGICRAAVDELTRDDVHTK